MLLGNFIGVKENTNTLVLEKRFTAKAGKAILRVTALGLYFTEINGIRVGDAYLTPGWTSYNKMLQVQEYDVSNLIRDGENVIALTVGEGWYCGRLVGWDLRTNFYGNRIAVCADLVLSDKTISTDKSWTARESYIRESGIYDGETVDLTAKLNPLTPCEVSFHKSVLVKQICEPVRDIERLQVKEVLHTPAGELVYDFGQNMAGVVEIKTPKDFNGTLTMQFAEILVDGNFYTENLRTAKVTDRFTGKGENVFRPEFTYHGFRYMKLTGAELPKENITAIVRHTDMKRTGYIQTDNARFNRLYENVIWGQKGNFVDIPTDCPQRDERMGWTGDFNAFCRTAAYNFDIRKIIRKWLADVRNDQAETGEIPHVAPDCLGDKETDAMWCDCITMVPFTLYEMYGDKSFLEENFSAMKKFISAREKRMEDGLIVKGHEFGDWHALDNGIVRGDAVYHDVHGGTDCYYIANVLHSHSLKLVAETAYILGDDKSEEEYRKKHEAHLQRMRDEYFTPRGRFIYDTVTAQTLALHFGIVPEKFHKDLARRLNDNVIKNAYLMTTGFIGTPFVLFALADNGYFETARRLLMNNACPGWLYEVDMGATTVWERWSSLLSDGKPNNPDGMNSYNHYAYGSVMEFVYRRIAGIEAKEAGFKKIKLAPNPCKGLVKFKAEYQSVNGKIVSGYEQKNGRIQFFAEIPNGIETEIILPKEKPIIVNGGTHTFECKWEDLSAMPFTPDSMVNEVFENPKAQKAFNEAFGGIFEGKEIAWMRLMDKTLQFMAEFRDGEGKMKLSDFPQMLKRANELFLKEVGL